MVIALPVFYLVLIFCYEHALMHTLTLFKDAIPNHMRDVLSGTLGKEPEQFMEALSLGRAIR